MELQVRNPDLCLHKQRSWWRAGEEASPGRNEGSASPLEPGAKGSPSAPLRSLIAESSQGPLDYKLVMSPHPQDRHCATRCSAVTPAQRGEIGGGVSGSDGFTWNRKRKGTLAARKPAVMPRR